MRPLILILVCLVPATTGLSAPNVFELNYNTTVYQVDAANNAEISSGNAPWFSDSLAISPSFNLYSADSGGILWDITSAPVPVGPTGLTQIRDLVWANNGLWGFSGASSSLFFYDLGTNAVTYSAVIAGLGGATITGVAYEAATTDIYPSGYTAYNNDLLFHVPSAATNAVAVGSMTISDAASYISDIEFDASGNLYAMSFYHRDFYSVNTSNAATTFLSTGPHRDTTAMAMEPVPEPTTFLLTLLGIGTLALARRTRAKVF